MAFWDFRYAAIALVAKRARRGGAAAGGPIRNARLLAAAAEACGAARNAAAVALCGCARLRYRASKRWLGRIEKTLLHTRMCIFSVSLFYVIFAALLPPPRLGNSSATAQNNLRCASRPLRHTTTSPCGSRRRVGAQHATSCPEIQSTVALVERERLECKGLCKRRTRRVEAGFST